jgi:hypothetical protein
MRAGAPDALAPGVEQRLIDLDPLGLQLRPAAGEEQIGAG